MISQTLFDGILITLSRSFVVELLAEDFVDVLEQLFVTLLFVLPVIFLILGLLGFLFHQVSIEGVVECEHVYIIVHLVHSILE